MTTTQLSTMTDAQLTDLEALAQDLHSMIDTDALTYEYTTDVISEALIDETIELTEMLLTAYDDSEQIGFGAFVVNAKRRSAKMLPLGHTTVKELKRMISYWRKPQYKWKKHQCILAFMHLDFIHLEECGKTAYLRSEME